MSAIEKLKKEILWYISSEPVAGLRRIDVQRLVGNIDIKFFNKIFKSLVDDGQIIAKRGKRYVEAQQLSCHNGLFSRNPKGFGYVTLDEGGPDVFIQVDKTLDAFTGDRVQVSIYPVQDDRGPSGEVTKILERARKEFVGCLAETQHGLVVRPLRRDLPSSLRLHYSGKEPDLNKAKPGEWVIATFLPRTDERAPLEVAIARKVSKTGTVAGDLGAVCKEYGIPRLYSKPAEAKAQALQPLKIPREDCRSLLTFTIDPADAKDFDDAVSLQYQEGAPTAIIGVHIADVACYVPHGSFFDKHARQRGFTAYLPGKTIGMLPDSLSSDLCSLRPQEERLAHSIFLTIDIASGKVLSSRRTHTLLKSDHRLCYEQVDRILAGETDPELPEEFQKQLCFLGKLTAGIRQWRQREEQFLPFEAPEIRILVSGKPPKIIGLSRKQPGPSARMIEEFMLAANVEVAKELQKRRILGLYRNHEAPTPDTLEGLGSLLKNSLQLAKRPSFASRSKILSTLNSLSRHAASEIISMAMIRSMPRASYSLDNLGHFGLGKEIYCHFTSPIRRYADLLTHQQLLAADLGTEPVSKDKVREIEDAINALEINIDQAGFALADRLKIRMLADSQKLNPQQPIQCIVSKASAAGLTLYIPQYGLMGFLETRSLPGGIWRYDARLATLSNSRQTYQFGDTLYARIAKADAVRNELLLKPLNPCKD